MEAFLEAAVLAAVAAKRRDLTLLVVGAAVVHALCDAAAEEALQGNKNQAVDMYHVTAFCAAAKDPSKWA